MSDDNKPYLWQQVPADKKYRHELWLVLSAIRECQLAYGDKFTVDTFEIDGVDTDSVTKKLQALDKQKVLKYRSLDNMDISLPLTPPHTEAPSVMYGKHPILIRIELNEQAFDDFYLRYSEIIAEEKEPLATDEVSRITVRLVKDGLNLYLRSSDGQQIVLNRFRADLTPAKLVDYLLARPNTIIQMSQLKLEGSGFGTTNNVAEKLRKAGFTETIKRYFLPDSDQQKVRLRDEVEMSSSEFEKIKAELQSKTKSE